MSKMSNEEYLNQFKNTELYKKLVSIEKGEPFLMLCYTLETEEKRQKLLDYIKEYDVNDSGDVVMLVECIHNGVEPELEEV